MNITTRLTTDAIGVFAMLRDAIKHAGGQRQFAEQAGVSQAHVSQVMASVRQPGPALLRALGMRRVVRFERVRP